MTVSARRALFALCGSVLAAFGLGYSWIRVRADGVPQRQPLWYSGTVADAGGRVLDANYNIKLGLYEQRHPQAGEMPVCSVKAENTRIASGRFRVDASECAAALQANPDLFAELTVSDDSNAGKPFERAKVGAVPFAFEAQHAVNGVPAGAIVMFAGSCPAGWTEYAPLRGRFPRGEGSGDPKSLDAAGSDDSSVVAHSHGVGSVAVVHGGEHTHAISCKHTVGAHYHGGLSTFVSEAPNPVSGDCSPLPSTQSAGMHSHSLVGATAISGDPGQGKNLPRFQEVIFCAKN